MALLRMQVSVLAVMGDMEESWMLLMRKCRAVQLRHSRLTLTYRPPARLDLRVLRSFGIPVGMLEMRVSQLSHSMVEFAFALAETTVLWLVHHGLPLVFLRLLTMAEKTQRKSVGQA